jgi:hypothetical protein
LNIQVSIIIVNYKSERYLGACIDSIYGHVEGISYEIIVVDNDSSVDLHNFIAQKYPNVKLVLNSKNLGFGAANNKGAMIAAGDYLFFLNPDTILLDNAILKFYQFLKEGLPNTASCGGNLINSNNEPTTSYGNFPSFFQELGDMGLRRFFKKHYEKHLRIGKNCSQLTTPTQVPYIVGADIFITKKIFKDICGFDETFFLYYEETDLYYRLNKAGYTSYILPDVKIIHMEGTALFYEGKLNLEKWAVWEKSKYYYFRKHKGRWIAVTIKIMQLISLVIHYFFGSSIYPLRKTMKITCNA